MVKINYAFFCQYFIISQEGVPSFMSVFSQLIGKIPLKSDIRVVINFSANKEEGGSDASELEIIAKSPSNKVVGSVKNKLLRKNDDEQNIGFISKVSNVEFEEEGEYKFEVLFNGKVIETIPLLFTAQK